MAKKKEIGSVRGRDGAQQAPASAGIDELLSTLQQKFGEGAIMKLGEARKMDVAVIPTGSFSLDMALGVGGLPRGRIVEVFGPEGSGKCISRDSIVFSEHGMLPIDSFGRLVIPGFQKKKALVYSEHSFAETSHFYNSGVQKTIRLETHYGFTLEGTPNHRIRVIDSEGNYIFRRLDELQPSDYVAIQRGQNFFGKGIDLSGFVYKKSRFNVSKKTFAAPKTLTTELAALMGYLVGDGTITNTGLNKNNIQFTCGDEETGKDFSGLCQTAFGEMPKVTKDKRTKTTTRMTVHNAHARAFLEYAGLGWHDAGTKEIPWSVLCSPKEIVSAFLSALFECDGCFSGATIEYTTKSTKLAKQIQVVLLNYSIVAKRRARIVSGRTYYYLYIEGQRDKENFLKEIGFRSEKKNDFLRRDIRKRKLIKTNLDLIPNTAPLLKRFFEKFRDKVRPANREDWDMIYDYLPRPQGGGHGLSYDRLSKILKHFYAGRNLPEYQQLELFQELGLFFDKIKKIEKSVAHVVDFTVPKNATFFANGFVNHNTTLALNVVAQAQKQGGKAAYIDAEHALDPEYAAKLGVKVNDLLISQPDNGEEALNILESLVRSGMISVIVVDSVAALTPKAEIEGEMGAQYVGLQARMMSQALRKITALAARSQTLIIFINQIRMQIGVMFGCLHYKSKVALADGSQEWIGKIVNQKLPVSVLAYDWKKKRIIPAPITGWYNNGRTDRFLQITTYNPSGSGVAHVACTPNHPIMTPVGWRRAEELKKGDLVMLAVTHRLNDLQREVIRGSLLGDGNLSPTHHKASMGVRFRLGHSLKQKTYLEWKSKFFKNIPSTLYADKKSIKFDLTPLPELYGMRTSMYRNGKKTLTPDFLAALTPFSLAIWYQDDGCLTIRNKAGSKGRVDIVVQALDPESRIAMQALLKNRYGIEARLHNKGSRKQGTLSFDQRNTEKLLQLIRFYVHPSMQYKVLPQYRCPLSVAPVFDQPKQLTVAVPIIRIDKKPKTRGMNRFDIRVRGHHNFLADGIVVHNSPETTPGGRALKFFSSVRIDIRRIAQVKKGEETVGNRVKAKVVKNKVAPPFKTAEFDILFGSGISYEGDVLNTAIKYGVVNKSGASYSFEGERLGTGFEAVRGKLKEDKKLLNAIKSAVVKAAKEAAKGEKE